MAVVIRVGKCRKGLLSGINRQLRLVRVVIVVIVLARANSRWSNHQQDQHKNPHAANVHRYHLCWVNYPKTTAEVNQPSGSIDALSNLFSVSSERTVGQNCTTYMTWAYKFIMLKR